MSYNVDDLNVGGQLKVGTGINGAIQEGEEKINGSALVEGPMVVGSPDAFNEIQGTLMVGPIANDDPNMPEDTVPYRTVLGLSGAQPQAVYSKGNLYVQGDIFVTGSGVTTGYYSFSAIGGMPTQQGDINLDSTINVLDIVLMVNYILNVAELTDYQLEIGDLNNDTIVNILDIITLVNIILEG